MTPRPTLAWTASAAFPGIAVGALVASRAGVSPLTFVPSAVAALLGIGALWVVARRDGAGAATFGGNFPVPLLGAGASPVLGWYGLLLVATARTPSAAPRAPPRSA
ncbi:MAG: hypothetical protein NDI82_03445 [Anaeromyxobacteraceae bacterium]|nr:hypothetical protein [Anaeromyxobacteraceae bacterium]